MKTKTFVKKLLCLVMVSVMLFGTSVSASSVGFETEDVALTDNDTEIENIGTIDSDIEIGDITDDTETKKVDIVYSDCIDADDGIVDGQVAAFPEDAEISTLTIDDDMITENEMLINLKGADKGNTDFKELFKKTDLFVTYEEENRRDDNPKTDYFIMQGGCTDGEYNYFAFIMKECVAEKDENNETYYVTTTMDTRIVCYKIDEPESTRKLRITTNLMDKLQHLNDMTYNSITGKIVIACCEAGYYQKIYTIDATDLQPNLNETSQKQIQYFEEKPNPNLNFILHNISCMVTSIGFNETRNQYVVGLSKQMNSFAILDSDFNLIKTEGYVNNTDYDTDWSGQGLHCDNKYIYLTQYKKDVSGKNQTRSYENRIKIFDWNGNYKKTIKFNVDKSSDTTDEKDPRYHEVENMFVVGNRVLLGFNCYHTAFNRTFNYIDITDYTYYIQYCPDENVENYYEKIGENDYIAKDNDNVKSVMIKGLKTHLYRSRITKSGKEFIGWTAYRVNANKWLYKSPNVTDESTNGWYVEGQQPEGYVKYRYTDTQQVSNTGLGGELVLMCAQWKDTTQFTVRFFSGNAEEKNMKQSITYGVSTPLTKNVIEKDELDFKWWNAYWPEKNMWYYREISNKDKRGWFVEGCEPEGYIKYRYNDEQSVAQTVYAGSNVYMYAVWNEFTVYYNANGVEVEAAGIIDNQIAIHDDEAKNYLRSYNTSYLSSSYSAYQMTGYYQYWVEEDKWMCMDDTGKPTTWYSQTEIDENGLKKYVRNPSSYISKTVREGEHLVLYAIWSKN